VEESARREEVLGELDKVTTPFHGGVWIGN
jgi:hypothetical protein